MKDNPFGSQTPYNIEGAYQNSLLEVCDKIDELRELYDANTGPGALKDVKHKVKSLIFKMARNQKFYFIEAKSKKAKKNGKKLNSKLFKDLRKKLDKIENGTGLDNFLDELDLMTARAGVFLKSFEESSGGQHYGE